MCQTAKTSARISAVQDGTIAKFQTTKISLQLIAKMYLMEEQKIQEVKWSVSSWSNFDLIISFNHSSES